MIKPRNSRQLLGILLLPVILLGVTGCGFQLRGSSQTGSDNIAGSDSQISLAGLRIPASELPASMVNLLEQATRAKGETDANISNTTDNTIAPQLVVRNYRSDRRRIGQARPTSQDEYLLIREVIYGLQLPDGRLLGPVTSQVQTVFESNTEQAISKISEERLLNQELDQRLVATMLNQLRQLAHSAATPVESSVPADLRFK